MSVLYYQPQPTHVTIPHFQVQLKVAHNPPFFSFLSKQEAPVRRKAKQYDDEYSESDEYDSDDDSVPSEQDLDSEYSDDMETYETVTNMNLRAAQLASFFMLEKAEETIQIILEIRDVLNISGDFSTLERLQVWLLLFLT